VFQEEKKELFMVLRLCLEVLLPLGTLEANLTPSLPK